MIHYIGLTNYVCKRTILVAKRNIPARSISSTRWQLWNRYSREKIIDHPVSSSRSITCLFNPARVHIRPFFGCAPRIDLPYYTYAREAKLRNPICRSQPQDITARWHIQIIPPGPGPLICWWRDLSREIATRYALFARIPPLSVPLSSRLASLVVVSARRLNPIDSRAGLPAF